MTNDPESNGVDEPDVKVLINARSKIGVVQVIVIVPVSISPEIVAVLTS